jgi:UDP-3-O-[3-hydroxymyristoyl] glucosamine N-acyltransferase
MLGTLAELAARVGGTVLGDGSVGIFRIAGVAEADAGALTFATDEHYFSAALASDATAVLIGATLAPASSAKPLMLVPDVRAALATLLQTLRSPRPAGPFRHLSAVVESGAQVCDDVHLGAHTYIGSGARIGWGSVIDTGAYVGAGAVVGDGCWLHPYSNLMERCILGNRVVLHAGCVIGSEGFGWAFLDERLERIPQVGNVQLDDDVEIGANTCIDRAQTGSTHVGAGTKIDNLCQIGHNCRIGKHTVMAAMCGLAGTTIIGDFVKVGGQVTFKGHITVGSHVTIAGAAQVWGDISDGAFVSGAPARDHRERLRQEVQLRKLPKLFARVDALERERGSRD